MFFRNYSTYEGEPARLYRSPDKIIRDIFVVNSKISEINAALNVRSIIELMIDRSSYGEPEVWIPALSEIVSEAEESLESLKSLRERLDILAEELEDTKWALGI